jgi:fucose 4-O-acetylase-like acetyltransferase
MKNTEKFDITIAKGLAIFLVVIGHILAGSTSKGNEWFSFFVECLYLFHMPFFMFLSGYTALRYDRLVRISQNYSLFIKQQTIRLLIPFFVIGGIIVAGKIMMQNLVYVDNVPENPLWSFTDLIWHTKNSPSVFLWYIFALFVYGIIASVLFKVFKYRMYLWVLFALVLFFIPPIYYLYLEKLTGNLIFFCLGGLALKYNEKYIKLISANQIILLATILLFSSFLLYSFHALDNNLCKLMAGTCSIPVLHRLSMLLAKHKTKITELFILFGRRSYSIYLLNTICIGIAKGILFLITDWHEENFYFVAPILIAAGLIGPLIIEWLILKRVPFIRIHILGYSQTDTIEKNNERTYGQKKK